MEPETEGTVKHLNCVREDSYLRLITRGSQQVLIHEGTGEYTSIILTEADESLWELKFGSSGLGVLTHSAHGAMLASRLLKNKLQCAALNGESELQIQYADGSVEWHKDRECRYTFHTFKITVPGNLDFLCEVYQYLCKRGSCFVWWAIPWIRKFLIQVLK